MPFTREPWDSPESQLDADDFCAVCLIDMNEPGQKKIKGLCKLPVRSRPGAPININALHAAAGAHGILGVKGVPPDEKRKAARKLIALYREAGEIAPESVYRIAGEKRPKE